jgi:hypothetical protein
MFSNNLRVRVGEGVSSSPTLTLGTKYVKILGILVTPLISMIVGYNKRDIHDLFDNSEYLL